MSREEELQKELQATEMLIQDGEFAVQAVYKTGEVTTIRLQPPLEFHDGDTMYRIHDSNGVDHFFNKDGSYDGSGRLIR